MEQFIVPTPAGNLVIEQKGSMEEYPGIYVSMENGAPVATIEFTPNRTDGTSGIQVLAWEDASREEPSAFLNVDNYDNF